MNPLIMKRNSIKFPKKLNIVEYSIKNDPNKKKNETKIIKKQNKSRNSNKINNNVYIKSKHNIQKENNEPSNKLKKVKSKESNILKSEKNKILNKNKNINASTPDIRLEKNEDSPSTTVFTKENIENKRPLSCEKRYLNKDMIFVKKKIQGNLKNSFILSKSEEKENDKNISCFCIRNNNSFMEKFKTNNNIDQERNINSNGKNFISNFIGDNSDNDIIINNHKKVSIIKDKYLNNSLAKNYLKGMKHNSESIMTKLNNSVRLRRNKKIVNEYTDKNLIEINSYNSPTISNLKKFNVSQSLRYRNISNYINNFKIINSEYSRNNDKPNNNKEVSENDNKIYNTMIEKNIKIKDKNINYNNINNFSYLKNEYINHINIINNQIQSKSNLNNAFLKSLNFEDLYLILKKFEIIKNNIILLVNLKNNSNKNLLDNISMFKIFIYDLYKFYLNSSLEGAPQNFFFDKNSEIYLHYYSVLLIISLGLIYVIAYKIRIISDSRNKILLLINQLQKGFLYFCDAIFENYINKGINDVWINEIMKELNKEKIPYGIEHISFIKKTAIEGNKIFNEIIKSIYNINFNINNKISEQEIFMYRNFWNKSLNHLSQIKINDLEELLDENIFKITNIKNNIINKTNINNNNNFKSLLIQKEKLNSQIMKSKQRAAITSLLFLKENIHNVKININNIGKKIISNKITQSKKTADKNKIMNNPNLNNRIKDNKNKKLSNINFKNIIKTLKVKEPYLDFPPSKKYTLVLDLDETMISFKFISQERGIGEMHLRPGLEDFLDEIKEYYEIIVFTSGTREYADMILDVLEHKKQKKYFDGRLYREHTTFIGNKYIKDLSKIGRDLSKTLIVDNLPHSFKFQHENGILISSFYGDDNDEDKALIELKKILMKIYQENDDVRKSIFKFKEEIIRTVSCLDVNQYKQIYYDDKIIK